MMIHLLQMGSGLEEEKYGKVKGLIILCLLLGFYGFTSAFTVLILSRRGERWVMSRINELNSCKT